jgi:hypothetical protein
LDYHLGGDADSSTVYSSLTTDDTSKLVMHQPSGSDDYSLFTHYQPQAVYAADGLYVNAPESLQPQMDVPTDFSIDFTTLSAPGQAEPPKVVTAADEEIETSNSPSLTDMLDPVAEALFEQTLYENELTAQINMYKNQQITSANHNHNRAIATTTDPAFLSENCYPINVISARPSYVGFDASAFHRSAPWGLAMALQPRYMTQPSRRGGLSHTAASHGVAESYAAVTATEASKVVPSTPIHARMPQLHPQSIFSPQLLQQGWPLEHEVPPALHSAASPAAATALARAGDTGKAAADDITRSDTILTHAPQQQLLQASPSHWHEEQLVQIQPEVKKADEGSCGDGGDSSLRLVSVPPDDFAPRASTTTCIPIEDPQAAANQKLAAPVTAPWSSTSSPALAVATGIVEEGVADAHSLQMPIEPESTKLTEIGGQSSHPDLFLIRTPQVGLSAAQTQTPVAGVSPHAALSMSLPMPMPIPSSVVGGSNPPQVQLQSTILPTPKRSADITSVTSSSPSGQLENLTGGFTAVLSSTCADSPEARSVSARTLTASTIIEDIEASPSRTPLKAATLYVGGTSAGAANVIGAAASAPTSDCVTNSKSRRAGARLAKEAQQLQVKLSCFCG